MNALRTIAMRLRGVRDDAGELVPKMKELIQSATNGKVNIMDGNEFKSTYQIMLEISKVWDDLSDKQKAFLAETVAGKNRAEVFTAIMGNSEDLTYAMEMAKDSIGSVDEEMAVIMQSFEKRVEVMKNAWASLANTTLSSGVASAFVDGVTAVISYIDHLGGLVPLLTQIAGLLIIIKKESMATFAIGLAKSITTALGHIGKFVLGIGRVGNAMLQAKLHGASFSQAISAGGTALTRMASTASIATSAIGVAVIAFGYIQSRIAKNKQEHEEYIQTLEEGADKTLSQVDSIKELTSKYHDLYSTVNRTQEQNKELLTVQSELITSLGLESGALNASKQSWQELSDAIDGATKKKIEYALQQQNDLVKDAKESLDKEVKNNELKGRYFFDTDVVTSKGLGQEIDKIVERVNDELGKELVKAGSTGGIDLFNIESGEQYYEVLKKIQQVTQNGGFAEYWDSKNYKAISEELLSLDNLFSDLDEKTKKQYELKMSLDMSSLQKDLDIKDISKITASQAQEIKSSFSQIFSEEEKLKNADYIEYFNSRVDAIVKNKNALEDLGGATLETASDTEDAVKSLSERASDSSEKLDILKVALNELSETQDISGDTIDKLIKKYPELEEKLKDVDSAYYALTQKISENKFDDATNKIADLVSVLDDLEAGNGLTASSFKKISSNFPELLAYMNDEASLTDAIKDKMNSLKVAQGDAYREMLMNSQEYYRQNILGNEKMANSISTGITNLFNGLKSAYEGDLKNWKSLAQGKADVEEQLITSLNKAWETHFGTLMTKFNKLQGVSVATPMFDEEAFRADIKAKNPILGMDKSFVDAQVEFAKKQFQSQISAYQEHEAEVRRKQQELAQLFDIKFDAVDIKVGGTKASSSDSSGSGSTSSYIASIFKEIVDEILNGGEEIEKAIEDTQTKLDNAILLGDTELQDQLTAKLANLRVKLRDEQSNMAKELEAQMSKMAKILSDTGLFKNYNLSNLSEKDLAEVVQNLEKQINSANLAKNSTLVNSLNLQKSLIEDIGSVYISTMEKRDDLSIEYYKKENERLEAFAENLEKTYSKMYDSLDREDKLLELRKSMLLEDGGEYDKEQKDADKIFEINKKLLANIAKRRALCESQIAQLRAKGFKEESEQIQALQDKWLDYEQARLDMIKEIAEAKRQEAIDSAQNELDDLTNSKDYIKDLLSLTIDMLKEETEAKKEALKTQFDNKKEALQKEYDAEKKALQDKLDLLKKEADARKEALSEEKAEKDYQENVEEKQKEISNVQQKLDALAGDDSITSQKLKKELQAQLDDLIKELEKIQYERSIELQQQAIDKELEMQEEKIEAELEKLEDQYDKEVEMIEDKYDAQLKEYDDYLKNQVKLKEEASKLIESRDKAFYERLKKYATEYTDTTQAEFEDCWNKAYEALDKYGNKQLGVIGVIEQMTQRVIALNAELKKLNDSTYKDFIQDDSSTSSDDYEFVGDKNNSNSSDKKVDEERDKIVQQMNNNSSKWFSASDEEKKRLAEENKKLASQIGAWQANKDGNGYKQGDWLVMINNKVVPVKNAYGVRHTGLETGEVGAPFGKFKLKSNEELNKLENGEIVINGEQSSKIMNNVKRLYEGATSGAISITVDMHDFSVAKDSFEDFKKLMKIEVPKIINDRLINRGIK